ncbi:PIG-L family deacetylase [Aeromicrobium sp.]|uniref:PIG-L deacetylase family protein n=1 Tax=Aeromicrobium sp. TaxID=1871063 RepID=UPI0025BB8956|nr:PIG-L family deacetylase [Aeromicrobium sp.]MCK5892793.1 PIG-L family deacetylase [Aeromicrobium sp.]
MTETWSDTLGALPLERPHDPGGRVLVLSAHPDDEVLAVGAWLACQTVRPIEFVTATDGEASHPQSSAVTPDELRDQRPRELLEALGRLGFADPVVHRLGLPDGGLAGTRDALRAALAPRIGAADLVLAPFEHDGHPDHDALGDVAGELCAGGPVLWRFPIWTWVWTEPADEPWLASARRLVTAPAARDLKRRAIDAFVTQIRPVGAAAGDAPIVDEALLRHAYGAPEVVIV